MQRKTKSIQTFLAFTLVAALFLGLLPLDFVKPMIVEAAVATGTCGVDGSNLSYTLEEDTEVEWDLAETTPYKLTITGTGAMEDYAKATATPWNTYKETITSVVVGEGVTTIGKYAFYDFSSLQNVSMPSTLVSIGHGAFGNCTMLQDIVIPDNVITIADIAFQGDTQLKTVTLGANTETIGQSAFNQCKNLSSISLNGKLQSIGYGALAWTTSLKTIELPESLVSIDSSAFWRSAITSVHIPKNVNNINVQAFYQTLDLATITVDEENPYFQAKDGVLYEKKDGIPYNVLAYTVASSRTELSILEGTEIIAVYSFYGADNLVSVTFPNTLKTISGGAFYECDDIASIILPDSVETLGNSCFYNCDSLKSVVLSKNLQTYQTAFKSCDSLTTLICPEDNIYFDVIDNTLYSEDRTIFYLYPGGKKDAVFHLDQEVSLIEDSAIYFVEALEELYVPTKVARIKYQGISSNPGLKSIYFYGNAPTLDIRFAIEENASNLILYKTADSTGWDDSNWTSFTFTTWDPYNDTVDSGKIGDLTWTFEGNIGRITLTGTGSTPDYTTKEPAPWRKYIDFIQTVEADTVAGIGDYAFYQASKLLRLETGEALVEIGDYAFADCDKNKFFDISPVEKIGASAFENNIALESELRLEKVKSIGASAFQNCGALNSISLGACLATLEEGTFSGCTGFGNIIIPESVTGIGAQAFQNCTALRTINIPAAVNLIGGEAFAGSTALEKVYFYGGIPESWEESSFADCNSGLTIYYRKAQTEWESLAGAWNNIVVQGLEKFYTEQKDHYSFANTAASFGYTWDYRIPRQRYVDVLKNITKGTYYYSIDDGWRGSCFGMAGTTLEFYENADIKVTDYDANAQNVYDLAAPKNPKSDLTKLIEAYQLTQFDESIGSYWGQLSVNKKQYRTMVQRIEEFERSGGLAVDSEAEPILLAIYSPFSGHVVIPVSIEQDETGDYKVQIYDPNIPEELQTLTINKELDGISYGYYFWASFVDYSVMSQVMSGVSLHSDVADNSLYVSVNKEAGTIVDESGNGIEDIEGAYEQLPMKGTMEDEFSGIRSFVLPEGNYTVMLSEEVAMANSEAEEDITFYMASEETFAKITSTDECASLEIQQTGTEDGELVLSLTSESNETEEASITLVNSLGMEKVIEMDSSTAVLSIADNENIAVETSADATILVDGEEVNVADGRTEMTFTAATEENGLKLQELTTEISCNETNALSGTVEFSLISDAAETKEGTVTIVYQDANENRVASYGKDITINSGLQSVSVSFEELETAFQAKQLQEELVCQVTVSLKEASEVSVTEETNCSVTKAFFTEEQVNVAFDGGISTYLGEKITTDYTYGDTITVKVTPVIRTETVLVTAALSTGIAANQVALFLGDTQLTESQTVVSGTQLSFEINTLEKQLAMGSNTITVQYRGDSFAQPVVPDYSEKVTITLKPKALTVVSAAAEGKTYDGSTSVKITKVTLDGVLSLNEIADEVSVDITGLTGAVSSANAGTYDKVQLPTLQLAGADKANYTLTQPTEAVSLTTAVTITKDDEPDDDPDDTPDDDPDDTPDDNPDDTPDDNPDDTPDDNPDDTPDDNPDDTPDDDPDDMPDDDPDDTPDDTPDDDPNDVPADNSGNGGVGVGDLTYVDGKYYFYENGVMATSKEAYVNGAWRWFDADGTMAVDKDVFQTSSGGKWVRYNENGEMIKGEDYRYGGWYYFEPITGTMMKGPIALEDGRKVFYDTVTGQMLKGEQVINGETYVFDENDGHLISGTDTCFWVNADGKEYWYEGWQRQGWDPANEAYRGKEIYDSASDAWYWLDNVQHGGKAVSKDVYQESYSAYPDREDGTGKWVRYDENGHMIKGWQTTSAGTYYFEPITGAMAKGNVTIDGVEYYFDIVTGMKQ